MDQFQFVEQVHQIDQHQVGVPFDEMDGRSRTG